MVSVDKATLARITKGGKNFEILVDPDMAFKFKKGVPVSIDNILAVRQVFSEARKGERVPDEDLTKAFGTHDIITIAENIIRNGEVQFTTEQRRHFVEEKKLQVASIISKQGLDPKTKLPHPQARILNAMEQAKVNVDPFKPANEQVKDVLSRIQQILPISLERIEIAVRIPIEHAGKATAIMRDIAPIKNEEWKNDCWIALIEIPAGMQAEIYDRLNKLTAGRVEVKILKEHKI